MGTEPKPNLFIIGAMKSGTTSLHYWLREHPEIFMCQPKEPGYFARRRFRRPGPVGRLRDYLDLFREAGNAKIIGESSTNYAKLPTFAGVAERISEFNPEARFLYLMRDPLQRTLSHYWHNVRFHGERRPMGKAIEADSTYRDFSHYGWQLQPYLRVFGKDRILALTHEELVANPGETLARIHRWLGVDPNHGSGNLHQRFNETPSEFKLEAGRPVRRPPARGLDRFFPRIPWRWTIRGVGKTMTRTPAPREVVDRLLPIQRAQTLELATLLGREFPEWKSLQAPEAL